MLLWSSQAETACHSIANCTGKDYSLPDLTDCQLDISTFTEQGWCTQAAWNVVLNDSSAPDTSESTVSLSHVDCEADLSAD